MNSVRGIVIGTVVGALIGALSLAIAYAALSLNGMRATLPLVMIVSALFGSAVAGSSSVILGYLLTGIERSATTALICLAVAALIILPGDYANSSLLPVFVYATAIANGLLVSWAVGPFCYQPSSPGAYYLSQPESRL